MVIACDLDDERLASALEMGADHVVNSGKEDLLKEVLKLTDGIGADAAIDITGAGAAIRAGLRCVRAAGVMVCVGLPTNEVSLDLTNDLIYREIKLTGISGRKIWETWHDFSKVMNGPYFRPEKIMGRKYALIDYKKAFEAVRAGVPGKMILYPDPADMDV
jgi:threonine 3-dehydrogenase